MKIQTFFKTQKGTLAIVAVTGIIYNVGMVAGPFFEGRLAQYLVDITKGKRTWRDMLGLAGIYLTVIALVQLVRALKRFYVRRFANNTSKNMRSLLYNSIVNTSKCQLEQEKLGSVMTKAVSDVDACVEGMRKFTTEIFDTGVVLVAYAVMLAVYDWRLALLSCLFIPVAYYIAQRCKGVVTSYNETYKKSAGQLNQTTMDMVGNAMTYRVYGLEQKRRLRYEASLGKYEKNAVKANVWESALQPIYYVISMCGAVIIIWLGSRNVMGQGWTVWDIGMFTTFFSCFTKLAMKSSKAAKLFNAVQKAQVSWKRIKPMFKEYIHNKQESAAADVESLKLEDADIFYPDRAPVVTGINLEAHRGEIIGITGEVACGKTAVGKVFVDETGYRGRILVNGRELSQLFDVEKRSYCTYMGHEPELMSTTIRENIELGDGDVDIMECLRLVCMDQEVAQMPDGVDTVVGNGGVRLSGGQQARLALARCVAHCKSVVVLDDPFAAVDKRTERDIFNNLRTLGQNKIIIILSHRLELFPEMDQIVFIQDGKAAVGTHKELMGTKPLYAGLYNTQGGESHAQ